MSLRNQFFLSVLLALFVSLSFLGAMASWHARVSVETEMHSAMSVANHIVESALSASEPNLTQLVHTFDGNRHIRAELLRGNSVASASDLAETQNVPGWFAAMLQIPPETKSFSARDGDRILLHTDPGSEIAEAWGQFQDGAIILALFAISVVGFLHVLMARTTAPLRKLAEGFDRVGGGNYEARVEPEGPKEVLRLADAFNRMTARLGKLEAANRGLTAQMLTIQEEERADLARDLHDEMGPFLFATRVEAEGIQVQAQAEGLTAIAARALSIGDAVTHIQRHVRLILKQLRPGDVGEVGLAQAISNLAAFWQRTHMGVDIRIDADFETESFGEQVDGTIYRLVQESLTNAVRHGNARDVAVDIHVLDNAIHVTVADNGIGLSNRAETGMGLRGMQERVTALGGTLTVGNRTDGNGTIIRAAISVPARTAPATAGVTA